MEPARSDERNQPPPAGPAQLPVVGPTEALRGRAGGPGLTVPSGAVPGLLDWEGRSGWQLAQQVWAESGISWEPADLAPAGPPGPVYPPDPPEEWDEPVEEWDEPVEEWDEPVEEWDEPVEEWNEPVEDWAAPGADWAAPGADQRENPADGYPGYPRYPAQSWPSDGTGQVPIPPRAFAAMPLGAPVTAQRPAPWPAETALPRRTPAAWPAGEPDALFRAWQGSVRQAADPRGQWSVPPPGSTTKRRRRAWRAVTIAVPAAVIVTVGAGAVMMLTGKADKMLAVQGDTGTVSPGAAASAAGPGQGGGQGGAGVTGLALAGYPGQRGAVAADSVWSAAGVSLAVGQADGRPAIWRRAGGSWTLVPAGTVPGTGTLTAVTHGPAGWLAVGLTTRGGSTDPLVLASADGVSWQPVAALMSVAGPDVEFLGVAAGPDGYAVVGRQMIGGRIFAALWWSADLRTWVEGANGGLDGRLTASTANAVAATAAGFAAVGSHGALAAIWTSPDGAHWNLSNVPAPSGARSATLRQVAAAGSTIVATGFAVSGAGDIPLAVVSADDGARWQSVVLPAPGGLGVVTALTTDGNTLIATGQTGPAGAGRFVTWTSPDGLHWSAATAVAGVTPSPPRPVSSAERH